VGPLAADEPFQRGIGVGQAVGRPVERAGDAGGGTARVSAGRAVGWGVVWADRPGPGRDAGFRALLRQPRFAAGAVAREDVPGFGDDRARFGAVVGHRRAGGGRRIGRAVWGTVLPGV